MYIYLFIKYIKIFVVNEIVIKKNFKMSFTKFLWVINRTYKPDQEFILLNKNIV